MGTRSFLPRRAWKCPPPTLTYSALTGRPLVILNVIVAWPCLRSTCVLMTGGARLVFSGARRRPLTVCTTTSLPSVAVTVPFGKYAWGLAVVLAPISCTVNGMRGMCRTIGAVGLLRTTVPRPAGLGICVSHPWEPAVARLTGQVCLPLMTWLAVATLRGGRAVPAYAISA